MIFIPGSCFASVIATRYITEPPGVFFQVLVGLRASGGLPPPAPLPPPRGTVYANHCTSK